VDRAWNDLRTTLPGTWEAAFGTETITVTYRLTARDSVIVETWMPGTGAETISTYHRDHGRLLVTHYCGQGNQPRLQLVRTDDGRLRFEVDSVTDLDPDESSLSELTLGLDHSSLVRDEVYRRSADAERTTLRFGRADG
jgi:hypothetical protein